MARDYSYTQNRELSWLKFDQRVMEEATIPSVPLFERCKFLSIFCSNLDEFFMIRVGSLNDLNDEKNDHVDNKSGMSDAEQLDAIYETVAKLTIKKDIVYHGLTTELERNGIIIADPMVLDKDEKKIISRYFKDRIAPILSPMIIDAHHPFPHLINNRLYVISLLKHNEGKQLGIVMVPTTNRLVEISENNFILLENLINARIKDLYPARDVLSSAVIRVTRNGDIDVNDEILDQMDDYRDAMKQVLKQRRRLAPVRLEIQGTLKKDVVDSLSKWLNLEKNQVYTMECPLDMSFMYPLASRYVKSLPTLFYPPFAPQLPSWYNSDESMINTIQKKDQLLYYPYESSTPFLRLLKNAAEDPRVVSIKITLYRLASNSKIVEYLLQAVENGKEVAVLIELKARFDEQHNIDWAKELEDGGCRVFYGFDELKVHSKICLITYQTTHHIRYIVQIGTGNYNEKTMKLYTDLTLMTSNPNIAEDAVAFFNNMALGNLNGQYHELLVAPNHLKTEIIAKINDQIALARSGQSAYIFMKLNSLSDVDIIDKLVEASIANVKIDMVIRGICCMIPQIPGKTENITIRSIVGRYLEHARIYVFGRRGQDQIYIASADMMTRNTENRVEVGVPIYDSDVRQRIYQIIDISLSDTIGARILGSDGEYHPVQSDEKPSASQDEFMKLAITNASQGKTRRKLPAWKKFFRILGQ